MRPGAATAVPVNGVEPVTLVDAAATEIQFKSAAVPPEPFASTANFNRCVPAGNVTPVLVNVCHTLQPPVSGSAIGPLTSVPSMARCAVPPVPLEATRKLNE